MKVRPHRRVALAGAPLEPGAVNDRQTQALAADHAGPLEIAQGRPILRGLGLYHGKRGHGISVEAQVKHGPITILGQTQTRDGRLKWLISEGWSLPGKILRIGNTNSRLRFTPRADDAFDVAGWMNRVDAPSTIVKTWLTRFQYVNHYSCLIGISRVKIRRVGGARSAGAGMRSEGMNRR